MNEAVQTLQQVQDALFWATEHFKYMSSLKPGEAEYEDFNEELQEAFADLEGACRDYCASYHYYTYLKK